ncbi:hypothetical protein L1987_08933 [Smallanthus sonchifolius]|uniref:Uncharacterized protein n=1 Tax=Smallanthus sonchifolius TaxID=185202 RepID=A0ACB9JPI2_9ASTR|nr:hypothetical protein L1987_08933 [Smallanthus sonchifolius]
MKKSYIQKLLGDLKEILELKGKIEELECINNDLMENLTGTRVELAHASVYIENFEIASKIVNGIVEKDIQEKTKDGIGYDQVPSPFVDYTPLPYFEKKRYQFGSKCYKVREDEDCYGFESYDNVCNKEEFCSKCVFVKRKHLKSECYEEMKEVEDLGTPNVFHVKVNVKPENDIFYL